MIELIKIENFKSIKNLELKLGRLNVLIGSNGAGKSNFVSFLELVNAIFNRRLSNYTMERGMNSLLYRGIKYSKYIKGLLDFDNNNAFFFEIKPTTDNKGFIEFSGDYFNCHGTTNKNYDSWNKNIWDKSVWESSLMNSNKYRARYLKEYLSSFTVYHFHDSSSSSQMRRACNINDNLTLRDNGANLAAYLFNLQQTSPQSFALIEGTIHSVAPYFKQFNLHPDRNNGNMINLEWEEETSDMYLDAMNFSDGTLRFIALTTLLLQPNAPKIIIIDEPELGLHPASINKLSALLKRAAINSQVIISTQSVELINNFNTDEIIVVDRKDGQSVFNHLDDDSLKEWKEFYSIGEMWEKNIIGGQP